MSTSNLLQSSRRWLLALIVITCFMIALFFFSEFVDNGSEAALDSLPSLSAGAAPGLGSGG